MMLARLHVNCKKAVSETVVTIMLIVIAILAVILVWNFTKTSLLNSPDDKILCLQQDFSLQKACYLNDNEVKVTINKGFNDLTARKLVFSFSSGDSFEITGKKCLDVKTGDLEYGNYCSILSSGETQDYIFNLTNLEKANSVRFGVSFNGDVCDIDNTNIGIC